MVPDVATALPRPALADHVGRMWGVRSVGPAERRSEAPVPGTALILALEHDWWIAADDTTPPGRMRSFAGGVSLGPAVSRHEGRMHVLQVDLSPLGTAAVLGVPGAALAGAVVSFGDLVGERAADELVERLAEARGWPARFALLEAWIARRVADAPLPRPDVAWAVGRLDATGGRLPIETLQRELGCSRRHLSTRFRQAVGVGPKAYARLVRFDRARRLLAVSDDSLAAVAAASGYSDQAHLTREVRAFAGVTPSVLRAGSVVPDTADAPLVATDAPPTSTVPSPATTDAPVTSVQGAGARAA